MKSNNSLLLFLLIFANLIIFYLTKTTLPLDDFIFEDLKGQLSESRIAEILSSSSKWEWINYIVLPIIQLIKLGLITICIKIGLLVSNTKSQKVFINIVYAEFAFVLMNITKYAWCFYKKDTLTLEYLQTFSPFSLSYFFVSSEVEPWLLYPLQVINLFEVSYWFTLSWVLSKELKLKFWKSFEFVMSTYGVGLLIWIVFVMFLTINMS